MMDITYNEAVEIVRDYVDNFYERFDIPSDYDDMDVMRCEMEIENMMRAFQLMFACDPEQFVADIKRPALWYSFSYGICCDLKN